MHHGNRSTNGASRGLTSPPERQVSYIVDANAFAECDLLPHYILLSTLTAEGRKTLKSKPDRIKEVNKEIEAFGAKVLSQYAVLGPYDFVNIVEAPDNETISRVSVELGSRGTVKIMSLPAVPLDRFISGLRK
jgi:uncharacterized protein with GYD domain